MTKDAQRQMYLDWLKQAKTEMSRETVFSSLAKLDEISIAEAKAKYGGAL